MISSRVPWMRATREHLLLLRNDAAARGMRDLTEAYGHSALRVSHEIVEATAEDIVRQMNTEETRR